MGGAPYIGPRLGGGGGGVGRYSRYQYHVYNNSALYLKHEVALTLPTKFERCEKQCYNPYHCSASAGYCEGGFLPCLIFNCACC